MRAELRCTYRVQMHAGFGFEDAAKIADYLAALGVSHLYSSPYLQATKGSTHGYDVVDHHRVNAELGGPDAHRRLCDALGRCRLGQVLDVVPNHMAITGPENTWWWDVLESGPSSRYASYFDVDWDLPEERLRDKVLLPVLGDHYGRVLEAGELKLAHEGGVFTVRYHDKVFPVEPRSLGPLLRKAAEWSHSEALAFVADHYAELTSPMVSEREAAVRRHRDKQVLQAELARLCAAHPEVCAAIDAAVSGANADPDVLDAILDRQNYRLAYWRAAERDLGYRRFFDIDTLAGLRTEREDVFRDTHALVLGWLREGVLDGLRVDHPDGLRDPEAYFHRIRAASEEGGGGGWIVVEKILEPGERLRQAWPVHGTTGYDFMNRLGGLFVDPNGEAPFTELYAELTGEQRPYHVVCAEKKAMALRELLGSDLTRLTTQFLRVCERHRRHRDYTRTDLRACLTATVACFPIYRTYVRADERVVTEDDVRAVDEAVKAAKEFAPDVEPGLFDFLRDLLLLRVRGDEETELVMRFQQLTGPTMAKGAEDTAFYVYNRFVALNDVGGDPGCFGTGLDTFHARNAEMRRRWPRTMLTTSTHDTKRSEDVRARLFLLSEMPAAWRGAVQRWMARSERWRSDDMPDRDTAYLFWQTLVGAWPIDAGRMAAYMEKATREAKVRTSWTHPNAEYDAAVKAFVEGAMADRELMADVEAFVRPLVAPGRVTSLSQTLLKLTSPGVPDIYQGTELWDLSLVDPDNRRPVDFDLRRRLLREMEGLSPVQVMARADEGLPKLWVIHRALQVRARRERAFGPEGRYDPIEGRGPKAAHVVAFGRGEEVVAVAPRLVVGLGDDWQGTTLPLPPGAWRDAMTGERFEGEVPLPALLRRFPVALLEIEA